MLKLFFIFITYKYSLCASLNNYCEICPNHTLCKYEISGPSSTCLGYDHNALLTEDNINTLVEYVNYRRNFIALGHSNFLPGAANMNKIIWSQELATSAQRWVDQCDQALRPDKKDQCRDLEKMKAGQNIATIMGSSPGFNVKSFIEMWFMQSLDYKGSVTYYNESQDYKINQFTQLIWADTEKIGCGKAKFTVKNFKTTIVQRLVCNFAPSGNVHGKPVYIIGYAATQCLDGTKSDNIFTGLCSRQEHKNNLKIFDDQTSNTDRMLSAIPLSTSLLRIRNLFNDTAKKEIDPVYNNLKQMEKSLKNGCPRNNKKVSSTIVQDIFLDAVKRSHPLENENFWINHRNNSQNYGVNVHQQDKGHSRVYHGHDHRNEFDSIHPEIFIKYSRRYDAATTLLTYSKEQDYRKHNINQQCTRNMGPKILSQSATDCVLCKQNILKCTRGQKRNSEIIPRVCEDQKWKTTVRSYPYDFCRCSNLRTTCPSVNRCIQNTNCECVSNCPIKRCPNMLRTLGETINSNMEKRNFFDYYDLISDRSRKRHSTKFPVVEPEENHVTYKSFRKSNNQNIKLFNERKEYRPNYSDLKRSLSEDNANFKPFWQMDGYFNKNQPQLKSIRYTTLANKKNKKSKRTKNTPKADFKTEHITLKFNNDQTANSKRITEKYLSFDELMHLRKLNTGNYSGRRLHDVKPDDNEAILRDSDTSKSTESTLEYTANTPFIRMKHCTRKLTCTWTAASLTDSAGSVIPGGAGGAAGHMGSRTPPGYVEGCTRTSTCTRDYMNRNKMATVHIETTTPEFDSGDDEDYCERRSLNRRNSYENISVKIIENNTFLSQNNLLNTSANDEIQNVYGTFNNCICFNNNIRSKRNDPNKNRRKENLLNYRNVKRENLNFQNDYENNMLSYGDIYYYVLTKILNTWKSKSLLYSNSKCVCNNTSIIGRYNLLIHIVIFIFVK